MKKSTQRGTDSETNSDSNNDADVALKKKTGPQYVIELQAEHACGDHTGKYCLIQPNGNHYHLTKADLSLWILLLVSLALLLKK